MVKFKALRQRSFHVAPLCYVQLPLWCMGSGVEGVGVKKGEGVGGAFLLLSRLIKTSENEF